MKYSYWQATHNGAVTFDYKVLFYCFDRNGSVVINFTLVFLKGNKTLEDLVKILETSIADNGTINSLTVARGTLRLILPSESLYHFLYCIYVGQLRGNKTDRI